MKRKKKLKINKTLLYKGISVVSLLVVGLGILMFYEKDTKESVEEFVEVDAEIIKNGIHLRTGLKDAKGLQEVLINCTTCHSSKLIIQNRMGAKQWNATIRWMQKTQGLWPLGENQEIIVNYLVENYPPLDKGRREALTNIDWYLLEE